MREQTKQEAKRFLDGFVEPIDYERAKEDFDRLSQVVCEDYKIADKFLRCEFSDDENFGKSAVLLRDKISINRLRIEALYNLGYDDTQPEKLNKQIERFMSEYDKNEHTKYEQMLYKFVSDMREMGEPQFVMQAGSYKTVKYELLDMIFHENRHIVQKQYIPLLEKPPKSCDIDELTMLFTMMFNETRKKLIDDKKIEWDLQDNRSFPIEFDARYTSLVNMNEVRKSFYKDDEVFARAIMNCCLVEQGFKSKEEANKLFAQMEEYYSLGDFKMDKAYALLEENKQQIIDELERRFEEMKAIVRENQDVIGAPEK